MQVHALPTTCLMKHVAGKPASLRAVGLDAGVEPAGTRAAVTHVLLEHDGTAPLHFWLSGRAGYSVEYTRRSSCCGGQWLVLEQALLYLLCEG